MYKSKAAQMNPCSLNTLTQTFTFAFIVSVLRALPHVSQVRSSVKSLTFSQLLHQAWKPGNTTVVPLSKSFPCSRVTNYSNGTENPYLHLNINSMALFLDINKYCYLERKQISFFICFILKCAFRRKNCGIIDKIMMAVNNCDIIHITAG